MLLFNTTYFVDLSSESGFLHFLQEEFIPRALSDGLLKAPRLCRIDPDTTDAGLRFSLQFETADHTTLSVWKDSTGKDLSNRITTRFGELVLSFSTTMELLPLDLPLQKHLNECL